MKLTRRRTVLVFSLLVTVCLAAGSFLLYKAIGPIALGLFLQSWEQPALPMEAVEALYDNGGPHIQEEDGIATVAVVCGVDEGPHCYYDRSQPNPDVPREISYAIIGGIGPKYIDHTPDNIAYVRCRRPQSTPEQIQCEIKLWTDWYPIEVK